MQVGLVAFATSLSLFGNTVSTEYGPRDPDSGPETHCIAFHEISVALRNIDGDKGLLTDHTSILCTFWSIVWWKYAPVPSFNGSPVTIEFRHQAIQRTIPFSAPSDPSGHLAAEIPPFNTPATGPVAHPPP